MAGAFDMGEPLLKPEMAIVLLVLAVLCALIVAPIAGARWGAAMGGNPPADGAMNYFPPDRGNGNGAPPLTLTPPSAGEARVQLFLNPVQPVVGQTVEIRALLSDCPRENIRLMYDDQILSYDWLVEGGGITTQVQPEVGSHRIRFEAPAIGCQAAVDIQVQAAQCADGQIRPCGQSDGCPGTQTCVGGRWGYCAPPTRICQPGERVSCSSNSCSFGLAQCNACGTGWLECRLAETYN